MIAQIAASADTAQADPAGARTESRASIPDAARDAQMLDELAGIGMDIARALRREALARAAAAEAALTADTPMPAGSIDLSLSFSRVARAVRLTLALKPRLAFDRLGLDEKQRDQAVYEARLGRRKRQVAEAIEALIEAEAQDAGCEYDRESLHADLRERLDDADMEMKIDQSGVGAVVLRICRDLGIAPRWPLWEETSWCREEFWRSLPAKTAEDEDESEDEEESREERQRRIIRRIEAFFDPPSPGPGEIDDS